MANAMPWSVRGIDPEIKEQAVEAAQRSGMSVGQWLNQILAGNLEDQDEETLPRSRTVSRKRTPRIETLNERLDRIGKAGAQTAAHRFSEPESDNSAMLELLDSAVQAIERIETRNARPSEPARSAPDDVSRLVRSLEKRLNAIHERPQPYYEPTEMVRAAPSMGRRGAGGRGPARSHEEDESIALAMAEIEMRRRDLDGGQVSPRASRPVAPMMAAPAESRQLESMRGQLDLLLSRIDEMRSAPKSDHHDLQAKLEQIVGRMDEMRASPKPDSANLQGMLDQISGRIEDIRKQPKPDHSSLQSRLDQIATRIEEMRSEPKSDSNLQGITNLQGMLDQISGRIEDIRKQPKPDHSSLQSRLDQIALRMEEMRGEPKSDPAHFKGTLDHIVGRLDEWNKRPSEDLGLVRRDIASLAAAIEALAPERLVSMVESAVISVTEKTAKFRSEKMPDRLSGAIELMREDIRDVLREVSNSQGSERLTQDVALIARRLDEIGKNAPNLSRLDDITRETEAIKSLIGQAMRAQPLESLAHQIDALGKQIEQYQSSPRSRDDRPILEAIHEIQDRVDRIDPKATFAGIESRLAAIATIETRLGALAGIEDKLGAIAKDISKLAKEAKPLPKLDDIAARLERIDRVLGDSKAQPIAGLDQLSERLDRIGSSLDKVVSAPASQGHDALVGMMQKLSERIELAQSSNADQSAFDALQEEIVRLGRRMEQAPAPIPGFDGIERTVSDLMTQFDQTRRDMHNVADSAASKAAQEAIRTYARDESTDTLAAEGLLLLKRDLGDFKSAQSESERRTRQTLEALHGTLESLVTRLSSMEAPQRAAPAPVAAHAPQAYVEPVQSYAPEPQVPSLASVPAHEFADLPLEPGQRPDQGGFVRANAAAPATADAAINADPRANFIAAARRAAQQAAERSQAALEEDIVETKGRKAAKASIRDSVGNTKTTSIFVRSRKPILLGIAALMFAVGALKVVSVREAANKTAPVSPTQERQGEADQSFRNPEAPEKRSDIGNPELSNQTVASAGNMIAPETTGSVGPNGLGHRSSAITKRAQRLSDGNAITQGDPTTVGSISRDGAARQAEPVREQLSELVALSNLRGHERLRDAAASGNVAAAFDIGSRYADGKGMPRDPKLAARWFEQAAIAGHGPSQYRLASLYREGRGVAKDPELAFQWFDRAAAQGHVLAMHNTAVLLAEGVHGTPDYAGAALWFKRAAEHGVKDSQFNVAILFARGLGVNQDMSEAFRWLSLAADQGDQDAIKKRDDTAARLTKDQLTKDREWLKAFKPARPNAAANESGSWEATAQRIPAPGPKMTSIQ